MQQAANDDLPCLTEVVADPLHNDLPLLTEIIHDPDADAALPAQAVTLVCHEASAFSKETDIDATIELPPATVAPPQPDDIKPEIVRAPLSTEEKQQLVQHLETHLETVFTSRLNSQLEQLQKLAVELAISEFKAELPQLLHDALNNPGGKS